MPCRTSSGGVHYAGQCVSTGSTPAPLAACSATDPNQWMVMVPVSGGYNLQSYSSHDCLAGPFGQWDLCNGGRPDVWTIP